MASVRLLCTEMPAARDSRYRRDMVISVIRELLRREGGDDFFEARIAAQRIPPRHQF